MKYLSSPPDCIFFTAILAAGSDVYHTAEYKLIDIFGHPLLQLPPSSFEHTVYYEPEMGTGLLKGFIAFSTPFSPNELARRKLKTRKLEWELGFRDQAGFHRQVNIDPGYTSLFHVVLATSKNFSHRLYLGEGVFAEVTLIYHPDSWEELAWTYPDYKLPDVQTFLMRCRTLLKTGERRRRS
ncbi:DUF4416 family protein [bacterium]|nr:DUF4416 family protein [candidate division CSSED10-310 bacterium]